MSVFRTTGQAPANTKRSEEKRGDHDGDPSSEVGPPASALRRAGWFAALWLGSVASLATVGYLIRSVILP